MPDKQSKNLVFLSLGSNMGDRLAWLEMAIVQLKQLPQTSWIAVSTVYETSFVGHPAFPQANYLNLACELQTTLAPQQLLAHLLMIEQTCHRQRTIGKRDEPRTLDIDLIAYGDLVLSMPLLTLPHPRLHERLFVLTPLLELPSASRWIHPILGNKLSTLEQLITNTETEQSLTPYTEKVLSL